APFHPATQPPPVRFSNLSRHQRPSRPVRRKIPCRLASRRLPLPVETQTMTATATDHTIPEPSSRAMPSGPIRASGFVLPRKLPCQIGPEFFENVGGHVDTELTAEFRHAIRHASTVGIVGHRYGDRS